MRGTLLMLSLAAILIMPGCAMTPFMFGGLALGKAKIAWDRLTETEVKQADEPVPP